VDRVLERFHSLLKDCYPDTPIKKDHPAIHLVFSTYGFDVVPAFRRTGGLGVTEFNLRSAWAIGTLVGVSMIISGVTRVMLLTANRVGEAKGLHASG
jgi:hypothetical protein